MNNKIATLITELIKLMGDDIKRSALLMTPVRVTKVVTDVFRGYDELKTLSIANFEIADAEVDYVYIKDVFICSFCEHHMMPFFGKADLVYMPSTKLIGLSKALSILNVFSARLQSQERLTRQVLSFINQILRPKAILLRLTCKHMCMTVRGVKSVCSSVVTETCEGLFNILPHSRAYAQQLISTDV